MGINLATLEKHYAGFQLRELQVAFKILETSQVFEILIQSNKVDILEHFNESDLDLLKKIQEMKSTNLILLTMADMAKEIQQKEYNDE